MGTIDTDQLRVVVLVILLLLPCCAAADTPQKNGHENHHAQEGTPSHGVTTPQSKPTSDETQSAKTAPARRLQNARIDAIDGNHVSITITDCPALSKEHSPCNGDVMTLAAAPDLRSELNHLKNGDHLQIDTDGKNALSFSVRTLEVAFSTRFEVLAISLVGFFLLATLLTWGKPLKLIEGLDHRYSNSQFQIAIWFWAVMATYLAVIYLRVAQAGWEFFGLVSIPQNLLLLSGMSALTFGGARAITTTKTNAAQAAGQTNPKAGGQPNLCTDLVKNDVGNVDIGDFQMLVVTLVAVVMYLALIFHFLGTIEAKASVYLPDVDSTILASFGLGQGAYLTKKAVGNAGTS